MWASKSKLSSSRCFWAVQVNSLPLSWQLRASSVGSIHLIALKNRDRIGKFRHPGSCIWSEFHPERCGVDIRPNLKMWISSMSLSKGSHRKFFEVQKAVPVHLVRFIVCSPYVRLRSSRFEAERHTQGHTNKPSWQNSHVSFQQGFRLKLLPIFAEMKKETAGT